MTGKGKEGEAVECDDIFFCCRFFCNSQHADCQQREKNYKPRPEYGFGYDRAVCQ